ncbi:MAG: prepilin-type N-terminal cleavage/methylation domain-containing protein [Candidatus Nealsonbacteria bacterium]|nr:prepilin-type N-terminal cleavage/methylation domain-containing protein [Candidatus Nealsonbacteria bacterium]
MKFCSKSKKKFFNGFTLAEVLVYVAVLMVVVLAVSSFFLWIVRSNAKAKAAREVLDSARMAMGIITSEIRDARSVYTPTSLFASSEGQLSLETEKYLISDETVGFVDFYLCGKQICFKKEGQAPFAITSDKTEVESLEFFQIAATSSAPSIQIDLTINYQGPVSRPEFQASINLESTASLRNY